VFGVIVDLYQRINLGRNEEQHAQRLSAIWRLRRQQNCDGFGQRFTLGRDERRDLTLRIEGRIGTAQLSIGYQDR